jgi:hypothetical protein
VLYQPEAHELLTGEPWNAERVRNAIRGIAAETEATFDDGWNAHPLDEIEGKLRTIYLGGAGVVDALRRLGERGLVDVHRDYVSYIERSLEAPADFPEHDPRPSLWMGETGIRLVLQRLAPSSENLDELSKLISGNARDERRELMWGSVGTMLAARELGLDDLWAKSANWLRGERDSDGLWEQNLYGERRRFLGLRTVSQAACSHSATMSWRPRSRSSSQSSGMDLPTGPHSRAANSSHETARSARSGAMAPPASSRRSPACSTRTLP